MYNTDTIAAVSTAMQESGIGIIRISGPEAFDVADRLFRSPDPEKKLKNCASHTIHYGYVYDDGVLIDEVLASVMKAPHTYTSEDTVEINCHGSVLSMKKILDAAVRHGARLAEPGEFTKRACLGGRIDLTRAEAVMDVIRAKNEAALYNSVHQLRGSVFSCIQDLRAEILHEAARIEAAADDPEHYVLDHEGEMLEKAGSKWIAQIQSLIDSAENGRWMQEGIRTAIIGKPNAGKSSVLNQILGEERAIVTEIAGTTRDVLTETVRFGPLTLLLSDTAGIRQTKDLVEQIGVERALSSIKNADLVLCVVDGAASLETADLEILELVRNKRTVILLNKSDLEPLTDETQIRSYFEDRSAPVPVIVSVCAKDGQGFDHLQDILTGMFYLGDISWDDEVIITNMRQKALLEEAKESLNLLQEGIRDQMPEDMFTIDLMDAYASLGRMIGEQVDEDLVNEVFDKFCMGK